MPPVICTCSYCKKCKVVIAGIEHPGKEVSAQTRREHEKRDQHGHSLKRKHPASSSSIPKQPQAPDSTKGTEKLHLPLSANNSLDVSISTELIIKMVCVLVIWLHLRVGISRSASNTILQAIQFIISTMIQLIEVALSSHGIIIKLPKFKLPLDIRSAYGQNFPEPDIIRTACCPSCFALYSAPIPLKCQWKESPRSRACNTDLWKSQNTSRGPKLVPRRLYSTQSFDSWLRFFLSRQIIEDALDESFRQRRNSTAALGGDMHDVHDSPAWRDLTGLFSTARHLVFGLYIDWFNPFTNKIAGMS